MGFVEAAFFMLYGLGTVLGTLSLLALLCVVVGKLFYLGEKRRTGGVIAGAGSSWGHDESGISPQLLAVLAAAAESAFSEPVRIVNIHFDGHEQWALEGRARHHSSHKLR